LSTQQQANDPTCAVAAAPPQRYLKGGELSMQLHLQTEKDRVLVIAEVAKIEVADIVSPEDADEAFFRTIRFVTSSGQSIEVLCKAFDDKQALTLHRVKKLKPVKKPKGANWLEPEVYTGTVGEDTKQGSD
jgi:hypothetical protein